MSNPAGFSSTASPPAGADRGPNPGAAPIAEGSPATQTALPSFARVHPHLYRGAQPEKAGIQALATLGIRTIVNLRSADEAVVRTGVIIACYRTACDGWTADQAMQEAKRRDMGWRQFGMKGYIHDVHGRRPGCAGAVETKNATRHSIMDGVR